MMLKNFRRATEEVPVLAAQARNSLDNLDGGVRRANSTMAILATVAVAALLLSTVALLRVQAVTR